MIRGEEDAPYCVLQVIFLISGYHRLIGKVLMVYTIILKFSMFNELLRINII